METDEGSPVGPPAKRHKKHRKKHKHSSKDAASESPIVSPGKASIKLKLKLGSETMGTKNFTSSVSTDIVVAEKSSSQEKGKGGEGEMSEEEKWLDALEKGTLNSYGEISLSKKDPSTLTARQRSLLHGSQEDTLLQLPSGYKTVELTDEQKQKRQEKAKRRRQQANEKIENDKTSTVHKLLKKQDSKGKRSGKGRGGKSVNIPRIVYKSNLSGIGISVPPDIPFPMVAQEQRPYPKIELCAVDGCSNRKTSVCSKSKLPVCGLTCYKKNLVVWNQSHLEHDLVVS